jgi:hypothetical protein
MAAKMIVAVALIVLGIAGLTWTTVVYSHQEVVDLGPVQVTKQERNTLPIPPIAGGLCLVAGVALLVVGGKHSAA